MTGLVVLLIELYSFVVFGAILASWFGAPAHNRLVRLLREVTEPALQPIRRLLPSTGGFDLSPMVLLILLQVVKSLIWRL